MAKGTIIMIAPTSVSFAPILNFTAILLVGALRAPRVLDDYRTESDRAEDRPILFIV